MTEQAGPPPAHAVGPMTLARSLGVDPQRGLSAAQAARRLAEDGPNALRALERRSAVAVVVAQLKSVIAFLLLVAAVISFAFGHVLEGAAVLAVVLLNTAIGAITELRAVRSMEALRALGEVETTVRRGGAVDRIPAQQVVRGDVLLLEAGDRVTADARLVQASRLSVDESTLTGESVSVDKTADAVAEDAILAERTGMLFKGTAITRGTAEAVVVATGGRTELGRIAALVEEIEDEETPLEKRLERLGRQLLWVSLAFAALVGLSGWSGGLDLFVVIETAIALAVATVPEGLPIVATLALARGMLRMAERNALVERLSAVETLGSTSVVITDKTGTLTENRMSARTLVLADGPVELRGSPADAPLPDGALRRALEAAALCNDAVLVDDTAPDEDEAVGDPMEVALLDAAARYGIRRPPLLEALPERRQESFDPQLKMMATVHGPDPSRGDGAFFVAVKGAPEAVVRVCASDTEGDLDDADRRAWLDRADALGHHGHRVLALASRPLADLDAPVYEALTLLGLIGLLDPPRDDVRGAVARIRGAGLRLVMATGDHGATARFVADAVKLAEGPVVREGAELREAPELEARTTDVVARASPEDKLRLLALHQSAGEVVAMLGDGVNDAPALEKADIGVAMGQRGTQVAREAADMVLLDDRLDSVVLAIEQGRVIFDNIRKFAVYLLACNLSEILVVGLASAVRAPLPLLPLQILFLNLVTDVFPALALSSGEATDEVMRRPPRPREESILGASEWLTIALHGVLLSAAVLGAFVVALELLCFETDRAVTVSFLTIAFAQLAEVFNVASPRGPILVNEVTRNRAVWGALALCTALLVGAVYLPGAGAVLGTVDPGLDGWLVVGVASLLPLIAVQGARALRVRRGATRSPASSTAGGG